MSDSDTIASLRVQLQEQEASQEKYQRMMESSIMGLANEKQRLREALDHLASYANSVRTDRRIPQTENEADGSYCLQTDDWCSGLLDHVNAAEKVLKETPMPDITKLMTQPDQWLILKVRNGDVWWWGPNSKGYTNCVLRAGRYTKAEADAITAGCHDDVFSMNVDSLDAFTISHIIDRSWGDNNETLKRLLS